ncbi:hypothetical protein BKA70DRAFT_1285938 [Coprinopsis sp. MPI-PUGE-AT-0042]|nr:hypothetical protein BKA70DRAFT_1285938 [Coprinopsis sp. MPI-PUGE-AT-0042]
MYKATTFVTLFVYTALGAAQDPVTIYDISFVPEPTRGAGGLEDQLNNVLGAVARVGGGEIKASAVAVDTAGDTYYVGVQEISVLPTNAGGVLTTVVLPTPTFTTSTFRADASRVVLEDAIETTIERVKASMAYGVKYTHDVDADTPVEEGANPLVGLATPPSSHPTGEPGVPAAPGGSVRPSGLSGSGPSAGILGFVTASVIIASQLL